MKLFKIQSILLLVFLLTVVSCQKFENSVSIGLTETELNLQSKNTFELQPSESYLIFGKGPGQDGAINPFAKYIKANTGRIISSKDCFVTIKNTGRGNFFVRVQKSNIDLVVETIPIKVNEVKKIELFAGYELYTDANSEDKAEFKVIFEAKS
tara:strand:+ start:1521 stop:1979 length:459 start_codon:yes stop_codon:yes gene_type:complete